MKIYKEKVLQELFCADFYGRPYRSYGTEIHLDAALTYSALISIWQLIIIG